MRLFASTAAAALLALVCASRASGSLLETSTLVIGGGHAAHGPGRRLLQRRMSGEPEPLMKWLVDKHNELRGRHGVPFLAWDWSLAWNAYDYVSACPTGHSGASGIGENLAWGHHDFNHAMRDWYDEIRFYRFSQPSFAENTGHFSALIWRDSAKIGCAANLRCRFKTWICQMTPPGNYVLYGGGVDRQLWTAQVLPPGQQWVTGTQPDGTPSYASYDPTGETTRGLPQPQYGELKNFGFAPKPGGSVVMRDWQKYVPAAVLARYIPAAVLGRYLGNDTLALLTPSAVAGGAKLDRAVAGWQTAVPTQVVRRYVPLDVLAQYVPEGVELGDAPEPAAAAQPSPVPAAAVRKPGSLGALLGSLGDAADAAGGFGPTVPPLDAGYVPLPAQPYAQPAGYAAQPVTTGFEQPAASYARPADAYGQQPDTSARPAGGYAADGYSTIDGYGAQPLPLQPGYGTPAGGMPAAATPRPYTPSSALNMPVSGPGAGYDVPPADGYGAQPLPAGSGGGGAYGSAAVPQLPAAPRLPRGMLQVLNRHNLYRQRHQAPPLLWDDEIAGQVADHVRGCPVGSSRRAGLGENAAWGYRDGVLAVDAWYQEGRAYNYASPGFSQATGSFTQLVWASTERVGCALAPSCRVPVFVCNYFPAGNVLSRAWASEVKPPVAAAAPQLGRQPAAVPKPEAASAAKPALLAAPLAVWPHLRDPLSNDGAPVPLAGAPTPYADGLLSAELQSALERHNRYRGLHQAAALTWDTDLAASAQSWAASCPNGHSHQAGVGENMGWGYATLAAVVDAWYKEVELYSFKSPGWSTATGHFTQVVWKSTTRVGCGLSRACAWATYVCQYQAPGNVLGIDWSAQVLPAAPAGTPSSPPPLPKPSPVPAAANASAPKPSPTPSSPAPKVPPASPRPQASPQPVRSSPAPVNTSAYAQEVLALHNAFRKLHQVPALTWDARLAASAAAWASKCQFGPSHSPGVGENLGFGYARATDAISAWYKRASLYDYAAPGWSSKTGLFTQIVWRDTKAVGCATNASCPWATHVCQYSPPGNLIGPTVAWKQQVLRPTGPAPATTAAAVPKPGADGPAAAALTKELQSHGSAFVPAPALVLPSDSRLREAFNATNEHRARHQVPAVAWDPELAATAAAFVSKCPMTHSGTHGVGENLAWGFRSFGAAVGAWYGEAGSYNFSAPGWSLLAGHFSQVVWRSTSRMGCATSLGAANCTWATFACLYWPPGNVIGADWTAEVPPSADGAPPPHHDSWAPALPPVTPVTGADANATASPPPGAAADSPATYVPFDPAARGSDVIHTATGGPLPAGAPGSDAAPGSDGTCECACAQQPVPAGLAAAPADAPAATAPAVPPAATPAGLAPYPGNADSLVLADGGGAMPSPQQQQQQQQQQSAAAPEAPPATPAAPAASAGTGASSAGSVPPEFADVLASHNAYRAKHHAPPLKWDASVAASAAGYVAGCPTSHSHAKGLGENLAWGYPSWKAAVDAWYNEVASYSFSNPGWSAATGHFTQLVWRDTTAVGCATNSRCSMATYICQYSPGGNVLGPKWGEQVMAPDGR